MTTKVITEENTTNIITKSSTINSSKAYFNFVNSINSPATHKTYEFAIKKYMQYYGLQAIDELLLLATNNKETTEIIIEDKIINWRVALRETIIYNTRHTYMSAILKFYEINDITLRRKRIAKFLGQESTRFCCLYAWIVWFSRDLISEIISLGSSALLSFPPPRFSSLNPVISIFCVLLL
jgi:hypothetical protein